MRALLRWVDCRSQWIWNELCAWKWYSQQAIAPEPPGNTQVSYTSARLDTRSLMSHESARHYSFPCTCRRVVSPARLVRDRARKREMGPLPVGRLRRVPLPSSALAPSARFLSGQGVRPTPTVPAVQTSDWKYPQPRAPARLRAASSFRVRFFSAAVRHKQSRAIRAGTPPLR